jgi:flagellar hook-length control protein FliK
MRTSVFRGRPMGFNSNLVVTMNAAPGTPAVQASTRTTSESGNSGTLADGFAQLLARLLGQSDGAERAQNQPAPQVPADIAAVVEDVIDAVAPAETDPAAEAVAPSLLPEQLAALIGWLDELAAAIDAGEKPSAEAVRKITELLDTVAAALGLDPAALQPVTREDFRPPADGEFLRPLTAALIDTLRAGLPPAADEAARPDLQQMAGKLRALIEALGEGEIAAEDLPTPDQLARALAAVRRELGGAAIARAQTALGTASATDTGAAATPVPTAETQADPRLTATVAAGETGERNATASSRAEPAARTASPAPERPEAPPRLPAAAQPQQTPPAEPATIDVQPAAETRTVAEPAPGARAPLVQGYQTNQQQLNLPQLAFEVVRQVQHGITQFQIRLDPPELGRIDVRMDIDHQGNVHARLTVEKTETLDLMQRDQRALERALAQAGLDTSKTSLEFSLRQHQSQRQDRDQPQPGAFANDDEAGDAAPEQTTVTLYRGTHTARGLNLIV